MILGAQGLSVIDSVFPGRSCGGVSNCPLTRSPKSESPTGHGNFQQWTEPNELTAKMHNRMPVIVRREDYVRWLDPTVKDPAQLSDILTPYQAEEMIPGQQLGQQG